VRLTSRRGQVAARATITERVPPGLIFANFHFPGEQNVNNLTIAELDPIAKIPEYKVCAVRVGPSVRSLSTNSLRKDRYRCVGEKIGQKQGVCGASRRTHPVFA